MEENITPFERKALYYETDQMGIIHHSNYIRWFEEARIDFLEKAGYPYEKMEEDGIMIPVLGASCEYKHAVHFNDIVLIYPEIEEFNGFKLIVSYKVILKKTGQLMATGQTKHCFTTKDMKPVRTKKDFPAIYKIFADHM